MKLNTYELKWIAVITMLIDHIGYAFYNTIPLPLYQLLRSIGRIAFPIYCFLLVEGFFHTRDQKKYMLRLLVFALISEIPFDLCRKGAIFAPNDQNVFLTLFLGFACLYLIDNYLVFERIQFALIVLFAVTANLLYTDYGAVGICTIVCFYLRSKNPDLKEKPLGLLMCFIPLLAYAIEEPIPYLFVILAAIPLSLYNGQKGPSMKYFFYLIYPGHMCLFLLLQYLKLF